MAHPTKKASCSFQGGDMRNALPDNPNGFQELESLATRTHKIADAPRNLIILAFGEFCGTFMFLLLAFIGTEAALNNQPGDTGGQVNPFILFYIASSFGCALAVNVWIFYRVSGGMFNPAVSFPPPVCVSQC